MSSKDEIKVTPVEKNFDVINRENSIDNGPGEPEISFSFFHRHIISFTLELENSSKKVVIKGYVGGIVPEDGGHKRLFLKFHVRTDEGIKIITLYYDLKTHKGYTMKYNKFSI